jgi:RNA polymerase Rpb2, domain 6/RNA polymerase Rpb1, domain 2
MITNVGLYLLWLKEHEIELGRAHLPDERALFRRGQVFCTLPFLRVYWKSEDGTPPTWQPDTWAQAGDGWARFLRVDQALDWTLAAITTGDQNDIKRAINRSLRTWLVPVDMQLANRTNILASRVEAIRVRLSAGAIIWSRRAALFPDSFRQNVLGLDPIHTPENERAGLTRYLCRGWTINNEGTLEGKDTAGWGPSTQVIPFRLHDSPRRLMIGASLQARAVSLEKEDSPRVRVEREEWNPSGRNLRVAFSTLSGWTHEDATVLSRTAAEKLARARRDTHELSIPIPAIVSRIELLVDEGATVGQGDALARAFIDLYALGWRRQEAKDLGAEEGWLEVALLRATAPIAARILKISRTNDESRFSQNGRPQGWKWRETITFVFESQASLQIGDKVSTRHGIKGVIARILDDSEMPPAGEFTAEIVLSPLGVARRGAMGQFREATTIPSPDTPPRSGTIFVMRQAQDAAPRCRVRGAGAWGGRGQRYGQMEFWALMAHGAHEIASELLSAERSTAVWMQWETKTGSAGHRKIAARALNRFLATVGAKIEKGRLVNEPTPKAFDMPTRTLADLKYSLDMLEDSGRFADLGGLGVISLKAPVKIIINEHELQIEKVYVLPPWLRPSVEGRPHKLTKAYRTLVYNLAFNKHLDPSVSQCIRLALDDRFGIGAFLRREVLGRRLTRSARAVIVPRPDRRIDEIVIPKRVADILFEGLPDENRKIVLIHRNPTLHKRGLLALRPVIDESNAPVFGLSPGVLHVLGADFDGDQVAVVALETEEALGAAERLLPGAAELRSDPFRINAPAFPLLHELSVPDEEQALANDIVKTQDQWAEAHATLLRSRLSSCGDGWSVTESVLNENEISRLWEGVSEPEWMRFAGEEMQKVYGAVRKKGQLGGILRRQIYKRAFTDDESFRHSVDALQAVTERLVQSALSVKAGAGVVRFKAKNFFEKPKVNAASLSQLDPAFDLESICENIGGNADPLGLLAWLASPNAKTLLQILQNSSSESAGKDPRVAWFIA